MKRLIGISICIAIACQFLIAQNQGRPTGLIIDDEAYNQVPHLPNFEGSKYNDIPLRVSLRKYCPTPGDQGYIGSCVGWACGYGGLTISRAIKENITDQEKIDSMAHSAMYIFNQILDDPSDCTSGSRMTDGLELLKKQGDCYAAHFDKPTTICNKQPEEQHKEIAENCRIKEYSAVFSFLDDADIKVNKTIKSLTSKKPVMIGMNVTPSFWEVKPGQRIWEPAVGEAVLGGHAMVVVGYDEVIKSFEVMNSWGPNFGDKGFIWIPYKVFGQYAKYGFQIILDDRKKRSEANLLVIEPETKVEVKEKGEEVLYVELAGEFVFRYPTGYKVDEQGEILNDKEGNPIIQFEEAQAILKEDEQTYTLKRDNWKVGDVFQLVTKNVPDGKSVYVFSLDPNEKLELHWPKESRKIINSMTDAMSTVPIATYLPSKDAEIVIPGAQNALQLDSKGTDNLCVLYADQKIEDVDERLKKVSESTGTISDKIKAGFSDILQDQSHIVYEKEKMGFFSCTPEGAGTVVPIVLTVSTQ